MNLPHKETQAVKTYAWCGLAALVIAGFLLRWPLLFDGVWRDEAGTAYIAQMPSLPTFYSALTRIEYSPPGYFFLMFLWDKAVGIAGVLFEVPNLLLSLALIPAAYCFGKRAAVEVGWSAREIETTGLLTAFIATFAPSSIYFTHQARAYMLAALLTTLATTYFLKALSADQQGSRSNLLKLTLVDIFLLYVHYVGVVSIACLGLCAVILRLRRAIGTKTLGLLIASFCVSGLCFLPWLPIFLEQKKFGVPWERPTPLLEWPFVFVHNLASTVPLPYVIAWLLMNACALGAIGTLLYLLFKRRINLFSVMKLPSAIVVLMLNVFVFASVFGYITPFYYGYFRYMFPISPLAWVLESMLVVHCLNSLRSWLPNSRWSVKPAMAEQIKRMVLIVGLIVVAGLDVMLVASLVGSEKCGARRLAADVRAGNYDNTLFVVAPDQDVQSLMYYLPADVCAAHKIELHAFVLWDCHSPFDPKELAQRWLNSRAVEDLEDRVSHADHQFHRFAFVCDQKNQPDTRGQPVKQAMALALKDFSARYPIILEKVYPAITEPYQLTLFDLGGVKSTAPEKN